MKNANKMLLIILSMAIFVTGCMNLGSDTQYPDSSSDLDEGDYSPYDDDSVEYDTYSDSYRYARYRNRYSRYDNKYDSGYSSYHSNPNSRYYPSDSEGEGGYYDWRDNGSNYHRYGNHDYSGYGGHGPNAKYNHSSGHNNHNSTGHQDQGDGPNNHGSNDNKQEEAPRSGAQEQDERCEADCERACEVNREKYLALRLPKVIRKCELDPDAADIVDGLVRDTNKHRLNAVNAWKASSADFKDQAKKVLSEHLGILTGVIGVLEKSIISSSKNSKGKSHATISINILRRILAGRENHFREVMRKLAYGEYEGNDTEIKKTIRIVVMSTPKYQKILNSLSETIAEDRRRHSI